MRVGFLIDRWDPRRGGLEAAVSALVTRLVDRGDEAIVCGLSSAPGAPGEFVQLDVRTRRRGAMERELAATFLAAAEQSGCDVTVAVRHVAQVDVYWPHGGLHAATLRATERARRGLSRSVARWLHALSPRHREFSALERTVLSGGARRIWCVSELVRDEIVAAYPSAASRVEVHSNGVDRDRFSPALRAQHRDRLLAETGVSVEVPVLLFAGSNWRLKGWPDAVAALRAIEEHAFTCIVAGSRSGEAVAYASRHGLASRVVAAPTTDMERLLSAADVLVQPTHRDPCSLTTLEALSAGVPVVTTRADGAADAIASAAAGSVVAPGDVAALQRALAERLAIAADEERAADARRAARAATEGRGHDAWLDGLCASLEALRS